MVNIPLNEELFDKEKTYIYEAAAANGYERSMIGQLIRKFKKNKARNEATTLTPIEKEKKKFIAIPYSEENMKIKKCLQSLGFNVAFQNNKTLQKYLPNVKDEIPKLQQSGIYKITCPICKEFYIGQTTRQFITRFKEHQYDPNKPSSSTSAVSLHCKENQHIFDVVQNAEIVETCTKTYILDALESYYIQQLSPEINKEDGVVRSNL